MVPTSEAIPKPRGNPENKELRNVIGTHIIILKFLNLRFVRTCYVPDFSSYITQHLENIA